MKANTHPKLNEDAVMVCNTCKTEYILKSTASEVKVELCSNCHPFYTGKQMLVDTDNLVDKFNKKLEQAKNNSRPAINKKAKRLERIQKRSTSNNQTLSLRDLLEKN